MVLKQESTYNYIESYLREVEAKGRYAVILDELRNNFNVSEKAILQNTYRLKRKNRLAQVRKEFYVIIPPQYSSRGMIPATLFAADMMEFLKREYYVGLFSAAALHGAGHQQPMAFQIITTKPPLRNIKTRKLNVSFFTKTDWSLDQITDKKTQTGYLKISSPELTAFDLVQYHKRIGGLNRIIPILIDLAEIMKVSLLSKTAKTQKESNVQRLGYLLEKSGSKTLTNSLFRLLGNTPKKTPLSLAHKTRTGPVNDKWKIIENTELDF